LTKEEQSDRNNQSKDIIMPEQPQGFRSKWPKLSILMTIYKHSSTYLFLKKYEQEYWSWLYMGI